MTASEACEHPFLEVFMAKKIGLVKLSDKSHKKALVNKYPLLSYLTTLVDRLEDKVEKISNTPKKN